MPELVAPTTAVRRSFLAALAEFRAEGRLGAADRTMLAWNAPGTDEPDEFARYVAALRALALPDGPRPDGWVPCTELWYVDGADWLGRIGIRHALTPALEEIGGHIGYDVRPSVRRRGHATAMLRAGLTVARGLGIESALLTCDRDNVASRTVIEHAGGVLEDRRGDTLRFRVPTKGST
ncbi:GNAT family N-acetyltransferase [Planosporangium sp. 12N6]|uniref:GNAT family N-acetyltransferase n=1 Tax=Planosporangium spinosum TaxID=3402278 RepID=UPI003CF73E7F